MLVMYWHETHSYPTVFEEKQCLQCAMYKDYGIQYEMQSVYISGLNNLCVLICVCVVQTGNMENRYFY